MKHLKNTLLVILFTQLFAGCDNDLNVIDDYKETPVIYGLINMSDSVQFVRVQKSFLGEGNALLMAQNSDSIYYDTTDISIQIRESINGIFTRSIPLVPDASIPKDEGLFVNYPHIIYRTSGETINANAQYQIVFNNNKTGKTVSGTTKVVGKLLTPPILGLNEIDIPVDNTFSIKITPVANGKIYGLQIFFNYAEEKKSNNPIHNYEYKSISYILPNIVNNNTSSIQPLTFSFFGGDFYSYIGSRIPVDTSISRPAQLTSLDFKFTIGAEDFYIYYSINQPNNSITQNIPDFTNLVDGKGIFSSRNKRTFPNYKLKSNSISTLLNSTYTYGRFE